MPPSLLIGWKWKSSWLCYLLYTCCCWADHNSSFLLLASLNGKIISVSVMFSGFQLSNSSQRKPPGWDGGCWAAGPGVMWTSGKWWSSSGRGLVTSIITRGRPRKQVMITSVISPISAQDVHLYTDILSWVSMILDANLYLLKAGLLFGLVW